MGEQVWIRHRFHVDPADYRPGKWPPPGPYWCSGHGDDYSVVIAYTRPGQGVHQWWPEASQIESDEPGPLVFSDRFPAPSWWEEAPGDR